MTRDYVLDQGFALERARLSGMEALWDAGSRALLEELGIGTGWKCLEVGAGGGSLVEWMAGRGAHGLTELRGEGRARLIDSCGIGQIR